MTSGTEFFLLGPLQVRRAGSAVPVPAGKARVLLAALLLGEGRAVPFDELAEALWGATPPPTARAALQNHLMRLRKTLGDGTLIRTRPHGYQLMADSGEVDLSRFEAHLAAARTAARDGDWAAAAERAGAGLDLWCGEPLADVDSALLATRDVPRLTELRLQAIEVRADADLRLGRHGGLIAELRTLTAEHPLRERLHSQLMLALYRDGRQAEALAAYARARQVIARELRAEPGRALRDLHSQILNADPALNVPARPAPAPVAGNGAPARQPAAALVPRQLPAPLPHFVGRGEELAALAGLLAGRDSRGHPAVVIAGAAGIGKTALALRWAHEVADRFPDGQLYVNLRGFGPSGPPVGPETAIRGFLDALGVSPDRIPARSDAQAGLYRSLLADRAMLILLDNARDEAQVRPLLPAGPGSVVLVTSRSQLPGLAAADGARPLPVDILSHDEAVELLTARIGADRTAGEPDAAHQIARLCARLPLALSIAAARAVTRPDFPLTALAAELGDAAGRLDALDAGDPSASVRAVFSWSYRQLDAGTARMFRVLGLHPGPGISVPAAASLAAATAADARRMLRDLARVHLITEHSPGRYAFHALLHVYAADAARDLDDERTRREALGRVLDHYLHTARAAGDLLYTARETAALLPPRPGTAPEPMADRSQAQAWFEAEYRVLLSALALAGDDGFDVHAWQLPWALHNFLSVRGYHREWADAQRTALDAATRLDDTAARALSGRLLAAALTELGDYRQARAHCDTALALNRRIGNRHGEAKTHEGLSALAQTQGHTSVALLHAQQSLRLFREIGDKAGEALALNQVATCHNRLGRYHQARDCSREALALCAAAGTRGVEGFSWGNVGHAEHRLGNLEEAAACYERALGIAREFLHLSGEATVLTHLGDAYRASGDTVRARAAWQRALAALEDLQHPAADAVRARLDSLH